MKTWWKWMGIGLSTFLWGCGETPAPPGTNPTAAYLSLDPATTYVGKETCGSCHPDQLASFSQSEMGRSFKPASKSVSVARWEGVSPIHDPQKNLSYLPLAKGDSLYILEFRLKGKDTVHTRLEKIDYIVGSGQHTNSHIRSENGYLYQMPLTWYVQEGKWDLPPGFEGGHNSRFDRPIEAECMSCHNGHSDFVAGSGNQFTQLAQGIDCERCHGPGSAHVKARQAGDNSSLVNGVDYSIVHPGKLPTDLQFDLCQRCHLQGNAVLRPGKTFYDFRPGMPVHQVFDVFLPRSEDSLNRFIMASQPDRLRMSACFLGSLEPGTQKPRLTCVTCHDPHKPIALQGDKVQTACQNCHSGPKKKDCAAPLELRNTRQNRCASCHMPSSGASDIPHVHITDHRIQRKPSLTAPSDPSLQATFVRLACMTHGNPSPMLMAEGYLNHFEAFDAKPLLLDSAEMWIGKSKGFPEDSLNRLKIRLLYLRGDWAGLSRWADSLKGNIPKDAWTHARIAAAKSSQGQFNEALRFYQNAYELAPKNLMFRNKYISLMIQTGGPDQALSLVDQLIRDNPTLDAAWNNRGYIFVLQGNLGKAEGDFRRALQLDPDSEQALANLASTLLNTGRGTAARTYAERLTRLFPDNENYQKLLNVCR